MAQFPPRVRLIIRLINHVFFIYGLASGLCVPPAAAGAAAEAEVVAVEPNMGRR